MTRARHESGFTLIEVIVSLALLSLMITLLYYSFNSAFLAVDSTQRDAEVLRQARQVTTRMNKEISMAYLSRHNVQLAGGLQDIYQTSWGFIGGTDSGTERIDFTGVGYTKLYKDFNESDQVEISYFLVPDKKRRRLYKLMRRIDTTVDDDFEEGGKTYPVAYGVKELTFRYYDQSKDDWYDHWNTTRLEHSNKLPYAVEYTITFVDKEKNDFTFTSRTRIRMAQPSEER